MSRWTVGDLDTLIGRIASEMEGATAEENQATFDQIERTVLAACESLGISPGEYYVRCHRVTARQELMRMIPGEAFDMQMQRLSRIIQYRFGDLAGHLSEVAV